MIPYKVGKWTVVGIHQYRAGSFIGVSSDTHLGSTSVIKKYKGLPLEKQVEFYIAEMEGSHIARPTFHIGDNFDMRNVQKKKLSWFERVRDAFKRKWSEFWSSGNHSGRPLEMGEVIIIEVLDVYGQTIGRIGITHLDGVIDWDGWMKYRHKPNGAGFWKRGVILNIIEGVEYFRERKMDEDFLNDCVAFCTELNVDTVIGGHVHRNFYAEWKGIRVLTVDRGLSVLQIPGLARLP